jgi:ferredoxin
MRSESSREEVNMRASVDEETCIGCGRCVEICPDIFELEGEIAVNKLGEGADIPSQFEQACEEAASECPVEAIAIEE